MTDYKKMVEEHACNPPGCEPMSLCMCALADNMANEIERLREALWFYADEENWDMKLFFYNPQDPTVAQSQTPKVAVDNGDIARAALKGKE